MNIKSIIIKFPSDINEQHKLTKKLDKIEKLLENLKDTNKKNRVIHQIE